MVRLNLKLKIKNQEFGFMVLKALLILVLLIAFLFLFIRKNTFSFANDYLDPNIDPADIALLPRDDFEPERDSDRVNILILGIRGVGDDNGGLLADTIILASVQKGTGNIALFSIPRDLYVYITRSKREKLNAVYAFGEADKWGEGGLELSKKIISQITGQYIDYSLSLDFTAFERLIDTLGGVEIIFNEPFIEYEQWKNYPPRLKEENKKYWRLNQEKQRWEMYLDQGRHLLDGEMLLYYVRARFSSSDFDRERRQQQVILAIKDKLFSLGTLANPIKVIEILNMLNENIRRDFSVLEVKNLLDLISDIQNGRVIKKSLDISPEGLLYSTTINGLYALLPVENNYESIRNLSKHIFNKK